jgi:hypothetical protein
MNYYGSLVGRAGQRLFGLVAPVIVAIESRSFVGVMTAGAVIGLIVAFGRVAMELNARMLRLTDQGLAVDGLRGAQIVIPWRCLGAIESWQFLDRQGHLRVTAFLPDGVRVFAIWQDGYKSEQESFVLACSRRYREVNDSYPRATVASWFESSLMRSQLKKTSGEAFVQFVLVAAATQRVVLSLAGALVYAVFQSAGLAFESHLRRKTYEWNGSNWQERTGDKARAIRKPPKSLLMWLNGQLVAKKNGE